MKEIAFFGSYAEVLKVLSRRHNVSIVFLENKSSNIELFNILKNEGYKVYLINDLDEAISKVDCGLYAVSASFGFIFKNRHLSHFEKVINIHPGCLFSNRGRHPLPQAIMNNRLSMSITAHEVTDEKIDLGNFIARIELAIDYSVSYKENDSRLRSCLCLLSSYISENLDSRLPSYKVTEVQDTYFPPLEKTKLEEIMKSETLAQWKPKL